MLDLHPRDDYRRRFCDEFFILCRINSKELMGFSYTDGVAGLPFQEALILYLPHTTYTDPTEKHLANFSVRVNKITDR